MIAMPTGCRLRRAELLALTIESIQQLVVTILSSWAWSVIRRQQHRTHIF
jgi:hypothetical protein